MAKEEKNRFGRVKREISRVAGYLWDRGWAERNAGNISVNIDGYGFTFDDTPEAVIYPLEKAFPNLDGKLFLVTATNSRMRDISSKPGKHTLVIVITERGTAYRKYTLSGKPDPSLSPTSELPTHLGIHSMIAARGTWERVVIHTHATELIALTQVRELCNEQKLNSILWGMHPETVIFVPSGAGFVKYSLPGSADIAARTLEALSNHSAAVWEKHGVFAIGATIDETFDQVDILCKSAAIWFMSRQAGYEPEGLTESQLAELRKITF